MKLTPKKSAALPGTPIKSKPTQTAAKCGNAENAPSRSPASSRHFSAHYRTVSTKMHHFENDAQVMRYGKMHVVAVRKIGGRLATRIAEQVEECLDGGSQCDSAVCPKCTRAFRKWLLARHVEQWRRFGEDAAFVTILSRVILAGELSWDLVECELRRIRQILRRNGLHLVGIGGTELAWKPESRAWVLHFHVILYGANAQDIARLEEMSFDSSLDDEVLVKRMDPRTFERTASYCLKFGLTYTVRSQTSRWHRRAYPLKGAELNELAKLFALRKPGDFLFLLGLRRRGAKLERTVLDPLYQEQTDRTVGSPERRKPK